MESVQKAVNESMSNQPFFSSYGEFKNYLGKTDGTMEYLYLSKEMTGLRVDLYVDDSSSYKRHKHPLWLYFCNGYLHDDNLIPLSVTDNPAILIRDCEIGISSIDFENIKLFIQENLQILNDIASENIDSIEFSALINTSFV